MNHSKILLATLLCLLLCLAVPAAPKAAHIEKYKSLEKGENIFYGRAWYVREKDMQKKKLGFFETIFADDWHIGNISLCFYDGEKDEKGAKKHKCAVVDAFRSRPRDYRTGDDGLFSIRTGSKFMEFTHLIFEGRSQIYIFVFKPAPRLAVSETGRLYYMGDFAMGLEPSAKNKDVPRLVFQIANNMKETSDIFAHFSGATAGTRVTGKSFNMKGVRAGLAIKKIEYRYSLVPTMTYHKR